MSDSGSILDDTKRSIADEREMGRKTALVTGSVAIGAVLTGSLLRRLRHLKMKPPSDLVPAIQANTRAIEMMEGRAVFYERDGIGVPVVLLHSINAAASSYEMKPIFEHLVEHTSRPVYALDWIGFGRSDRPPVRYSPSIYLRQLRRFLSEFVHQSADVIALSMASEYAADVTHSLPYLVRKLALISPTGLSTKAMTPVWQRALVAASDSVGAFEIFYYRLTRADLLRRYYERRIFRSKDIPIDLVDYSRATTLIAGAHYAPRYFVQGELSIGPAAFDAYTHLRVPTLIIVPENDDGLIQQFDALDELVSRNPSFIHTRHLSAGLMPQWETPPPLFEALDSFLAA